MTSVQHTIDRFLARAGRRIAFNAALRRANGTLLPGTLAGVVLAVVYGSAWWIIALPLTLAALSSAWGWMAATNALNSDTARRVLLKRLDRSAQTKDAIYTYDEMPDSLFVEAIERRLEPLLTEAASATATPSLDRRAIGRASFALVIATLLTMLWTPLAIERLGDTNRSNVPHASENGKGDAPVGTDRNTPPTSGASSANDTSGQINQPSTGQSEGNNPSAGNEPGWNAPGKPSDTPWRAPNQPAPPSLDHGPATNGTNTARPLNIQSKDPRDIPQFKEEKEYKAREVRIRPMSADGDRKNIVTVKETFDPLAKNPSLSSPQGAGEPSAFNGSEPAFGGLGAGSSPADRTWLREWLRKIRSRD
ncbi:MAG: hypothetical protein L6Q71_07540 [Planctomycetes bacterium]|nr:hypothetical protein [Planctomycetota bacterium]NUQ36089.1 hypothetical protein [Planctomycetaceae bacterium]